MDYWCNWSKCWTMVKVEDKTPPEVVCELYDATITCASYKTFYEDAVNQAMTGDFDDLDNLLGSYDKVRFDQYGNTPEKSKWTLYEIKCDSNLVTKDSLIYAQMDTHFLPELRDILRAELVEHAALAEAEEVFYYLSQTPPLSYDFDPEGYFGQNRMLALDSGDLDLQVFDNLLGDEGYQAPTNLLEEAFKQYRDILAV